MADGSWTGLLLKNVEELSSRLEKTTEQVSSGADPTALHECRKDSRRLRLILKLLQSVISPRKSNRWRSELKSFRNGLAKARDLDVMVDMLQTLRRDEDEASPVIGRVEALLSQRREELRPRIEMSAKSLLSGGTLKEVPRELARRLGSSRRRRVGLSIDIVSADIAGRCAKLADGLEKRFGGLRADSDPAGHHRLRIATRKLRYALEFLDRLTCGGFAQLLQPVLELQTHLGLLQDAHVLRRTLLELEGSQECGSDLALLLDFSRQRRAGSLSDSIAAGEVLAGQQWLEGLRKSLEMFSVGFPRDAGR